MKRIRVALFGRWPEGLPFEVQRPLFAWMSERGVGELEFLPQGPGLAVRFNANPSEVPGVWVPAAFLEDPEALLDLLDEALKIYYEELNLRE